MRYCLLFGLRRQARVAVYDNVKEVDGEYFSDPNRSDRADFLWR